ncbi:MAG: hypothetical protein INR71_02855, partial [Terriglobus roseus]|nr:hypothetical protein [Terriglobus roseus]
MASPETPIPTTETAPDGGSGAGGHSTGSNNTTAAAAAAAASSVTEAEWDAMGNLLTTVYEHRLPDDHDPSKVFHRKVNKRVLPDYYNVIKEPMALSTIKAKVNAKEYKTFVEFVRDFALIPYNAQVYNRPDAPAYQDALEIKGLLEKEFAKLATDGVISDEAAKLPYIGEIPAQDDVDPVEEVVEEEEEEDGDEDDEDEDEDDEDEDDEGGGRRKKKSRGPRSTAAITKREGKADRDGGEGDTRKRRGRPPRVDTPLEAKIKAVLKGLRKSKNSAGQLMIAHFERLPDKAAMPEYFNEVKQPIALDMIKKKLKRKKYQS